MISENSWLRSISLDRHQQTTLVGLHSFFPHGSVVPGEVSQCRKLQLNVLQLDVVHAVGGHRAAHEEKSGLNYSRSTGGREQKQSDIFLTMRMLTIKRSDRAIGDRKFPKTLNNAQRIWTANERMRGGSSQCFFFFFFKFSRDFRAGAFSFVSVTVELKKLVARSSSTSRSLA